MRLLPSKKDIDREKTLERKREIDSGLSLAKSVDSLREQLATEKKNLFEWRENTIREVRQEVDGYIETRDGLKGEINRLIEEKNTLLIPLNKEWEEVNLAKSEVESTIKELLVRSDKLKIKEDRVEDRVKKVADGLVRIKQKEEQTDTLKESAIQLNAQAQKEYQDARNEHSLQSEVYERKITEVEQQKEEYEAAMKIIEIREKEVQEKEVDLISRENHLATQTRTLQIAKEIIEKQNAPIN